MDLHDIISIVEAISSVTVIGGAFLALQSWGLTRRQNRAAYLKQLLEEFNKDPLFRRILFSDTPVRTLEDTPDGSGGCAEEQIEKTLGLVSYLCYLKDKDLVNKDEFILFRDKINRVLGSPLIENYLEDEEKRLADDYDQSQFAYLSKYRAKLMRRSLPQMNVFGESIATESPVAKLAETDFSVPTMIIKISRAYRDGMSDAEILEATRGWWRINPKTANRMQLILSVANGEVKGVYRPLGKWKKDTQGEHGGRYCFDGETASKALVDKYLGLSVAELFPKGASNPIRYFGLPEA